MTRGPCLCIHRLTCWHSEECHSPNANEGKRPACGNPPRRAEAERVERRTEPRELF